MRVEAVEEEPAHARDVSGPGGFEAALALDREDGEGPASVMGARAALEQAVPREAVDEPGQPAAAQQDRVGQVAHPHALMGSVLEAGQHLVGGEREPVGRFELGVELADQGGVGAKKATPGLLLDAGEAIGGCGDRSQAKPFDGGEVTVPAGAMV